MHGTMRALERQGVFIELLEGVDMVMFVNGRRVITNAPGAIVRSISKNYTTTWHRGTADYENICKSEDLQNCCEDVTVDGYAVATIDSFFPQSYGDEKGMGGGVKSGTINGKGVFKTASPDVFVSSLDGSIINAPVVREGDWVVSNAGNCDPAPIEFLPGYQINNPCQTPELKVSDDKTEYRLSLIVHGRNQHFYGHFVNYRHSDKTHNQSVLAEFDDKNDREGLAKRLYLNNVQHDNFSYGFYQNAQQGKRIAISFLDDSHQTFSVDKNEAAKPFSEENMQVVLLRLVMAHQLPKKSFAEIDNKDFSDIFRLNDGLRARVYQNLLLHQLTVQSALFDDETPDDIALDKVAWASETESIKRLSEFNKNWYEILPSALQDSVNEALSTKMIASLPDGFLYVYLEGHLWREIALQKGLMHEVDLRLTGGTPHRPATGFGQEDLMLPYKIAGKDVRVDVAYSVDQWSWGRIRYYGGMALNDERRVDKIDPFVRDVERAQKNRSKRFITLDLASLIKDKKKEVLNGSDTVQLFEAFDIYHLVIPNPVLPLHRAMSDIYHLNHELQLLMDKMQNPLHCAHGSSAALIYRYFFNPKDGLLAKQQSTQALQSSYLNRILIESALISSHQWRKKPDEASEKVFDTNDHLRMKIDLDKIKATLKVDRRQRMRDLIRALQRSLVSLVQCSEVTKIVDTEPALISENNITWEACLKDGFASDIEPYAKAFTFIGTLSNVLMLDPCALDTEMDLERDVEYLKATPGSQFVLSLHEASHPLYDLIHPNKAALEKANKLPAVKNTEPFYKSFKDYENTGEEVFNSAFFKYIGANALTTNKNLSDAFNAIIKDLVSNFKESLSKDLLNKDEPLQSMKRPYTLFNNYMSVIDNPHMPKTELKLISEMNENEVIIGMHVTQLNGGAASNSVEDNAHLALLVKKQPNNEISVTTPIDMSTHAYGEGVYEFNAEKALAQETQKQSINKSQAEKGRSQGGRDLFNDHVVIVADKEDYQKTSLFKEKSLHNLDIGSASLLLVLSIWNVKSKLEAMKQYKKEEGHRSLEKKLEVYEAALSSSYMIENVARSFKDLTYVETWYKSQSELLKELMKRSKGNGFAFTPLSFLATVGSSINIALSLKSLYVDLSEHSPLLLMPHFIKLGVSVGTTLSFIGTAAERAFEEGITKKLIEYASKESLQTLSRSALKKMAVREVLEQTAFGFERKALIRLAVPFANTYVGIFLLLSGFLLDFIISDLKDSDLLSWLKSSPFILPGYAKNPLNESMLLAEFAGMMSHPAAIIARTEGVNEPRRYFVEINLPFFNVETAHLQVCIHLQNIHVKQGIRTFGVLPQSNTKVVYSEPRFWPTEAQEVYFDKAQQVKKVRYYLTPYDNWPTAEGDNVKIMCQFRIILKDGTSLPLEKIQGVYLKKHDIKNSDEAHVYHAEPLYVFGQGKVKEAEYARHHEEIHKDIQDKAKSPAQALYS